MPITLLPTGFLLGRTVLRLRTRPVSEESFVGDGIGSCTDVVVFAGSEDV